MPRGNVVVVAGLPACRRVARLLYQQPGVVLPIHMQHLGEALVEEHVLAPQAVAGAQLLEMALALADAGKPRLDGLRRENLQRPVHASVAVVEVQATRLRLKVLHILLCDDSEPRSKKYSIRVHFDCPIVELEAAVIDDTGPDRYEDVQIQGRPELSTLFTLQVARNQLREEARDDVHAYVTIDRVLVAKEEARLVLELPLQQLQLRAGGHREGEAVEGPARRRHRQRDRLPYLRRLP
mmetsp:Transcript_1740/g.4525  ORF Transcript_1740/g.4525 Transcript_1740/m.4525 type:complete len:238 (-) Transcript_1740:215-928(-)